MHTSPLGLKLLTISQPYLNLHKKWLSHAQILKYTWFLAVGLKAKTTFDEKGSCFLLSTMKNISLKLLLENEIYLTTFKVQVKQLWDHP